MALRQYRPVGLADEKQHLGEMVVIIIDRKDWQLHPYWLSGFSLGSVDLVGESRDVTASIPQA